MVKEISLYVMALLYVAAGANHFINPRFYKPIMPPWLPWHMELIYISGACEILFGALLIPAATRIPAAWLIIALLIAVFPANIQMLINFNAVQHKYLWAAWLRLPLQLVLIWWAWIFTR